MTATAWPERFRRLFFASWSVVGVVLVAGFVVWGFHELGVFTPLMAAGIVVFLLNPVVSWLEGKGVKRLYGCLLTYLGFVLGLALLGLLVYPYLAGQVGELGRDWPLMERKLTRFLEDQSRRFGLDFLDPDNLPRLLAGLGDYARKEGSGLLAGAGGAVLTAVEVVLSPIIALYVLIDLPHLLAAGRRLLPEAAREETEFLLQGCARIVMGFFRGQLFVAVVVGTLSSIGFAIAGVPFAVAVGAAGGIANIVPYIGPWVGGGLAVLVSLAFADSPVTALWAVAVALAVQQVDNHFISPVVMKRAVKVHPAAVLLGLIGGGHVAGFWGLLLAVPVIAVFKLAVGHFWRTRVLHEPVARAEAVEDAELPPLDAAVPRASPDADAGESARGESAEPPE